MILKGTFHATLKEGKIEKHPAFKTEGVVYSLLTGMEITLSGRFQAEMFKGAPVCIAPKMEEVYGQYEEP